jgi:hypothetical protein
VSTDFSTPVVENLLLGYELGGGAILILELHQIISFGKIA